VFLDPIEGWSENAANNPDEDASQPYIRDARRALHAVMPAA